MTPTAAYIGRASVLCRCSRSAHPVCVLGHFGGAASETRTRRTLSHSVEDGARMCAVAMALHFFCARCSMEVHGNVAEITFRRHSCLLRKPPPERSGGGLLFLVKMNRQSTFHSFALEADGPRWGVPSIADPSIVTFPFTCASLRQHI